MNDYLDPTEPETNSSGACRELLLTQNILGSALLNPDAVPVNSRLTDACHKGDLLLVKHLLASPELKIHADIHANNDSALHWASFEGHMDVVKYLLTSPELKSHAHLHAQNDQAFRNACFKGHLEMVRYLLTSPELSEHANIHAQSDGGLCMACENGHLDIVKYLLTSPELDQHAHIHVCDDFALKWAFKNNHMHVVTFLLYDMNMQISPESGANILSDNSTQAIMAMVHKRDLFFKINSSLNVHEHSPTHAPKAKI